MTQDWNGQRVVVMGAARQGLALTRYLVQRGAQVALTDQRSWEQMQAEREALAHLPVEWVLGGHPLSLLEGADLVCLSGGVPIDLPLVKAAQERGLPLSNDSQIFLEAASCRTIGITGSAGKTTTTTLVGRMAEQGLHSGRVLVGGNIGRPLIERVDELTSQDLAVIELSSFQLELMTRSTQVGAITNITPNHLDRHGTMEAYTTAKAHLLIYQTPNDCAVLNREDSGAWQLRSLVKGRLLSFGLGPLPAGQEGAFLEGQELRLRLIQNGTWTETTVLERAEIELRGNHNLLNVLAAAAICAAAGLPTQAMREGVRGFHGVAHRLEYVRTWGGARWYNDSIATAPERTMAAIHAFEEPLILLVGGRDKHLPWEDFARLAHQRVDALIVFGEASEVILSALKACPSDPTRRKPLSVTRCAGLREAVAAAAQIVQPGAVVLLSPGGTSFDEFKDFEERGQCFAQWVNSLP